MHQEDTDIIKRSNVQTDVVVVNQCDHNNTDDFDFVNKYGRLCHAKVIATTERGLSKSRNMALKNAWGDICLICDDDEILADDYEKKILDAYINHTDISFAAFCVNRSDSHCPAPVRKKKINFKLCLKLSSVQLTFRRKDILENRIRFDEKIGSGTGNGGGEDNGWLLSCRRQGLIGYFFPDIIASLIDSDSNWFKGYNEKYFLDKGYSMKRIMGTPLAMIYLLYWNLSHHNLYGSDISILKSLKYSFKGIFQNQ